MPLRAHAQRLSAVVSTLLLTGCLHAVTGPLLESHPAGSRIDWQWVDVILQEQSYAIEGSTAQTLTEQMKQLGPADSNGDHNDAYTRWYVTWTFAFAKSAEGCRIAEVHVKVHVNTTLPAWTAPGDATADLPARWKKFSGALALHERGHLQIGVHSGQEIRQAMLTLPPTGSCDTVEGEANEIARAIVTLHNTYDREYDEKTLHGFTQGTDALVAGADPSPWSSEGAAR